MPSMLELSAGVLSELLLDLAHGLHLVIRIGRYVSDRHLVSNKVS